MERAAFLIEKTGERIPCLLNPASVVMRRVAGVRPRLSIGGPLTGAGLSDAPLHFTGGGSTEITMDLLFDVSLVLAEPRPENVRELTEPLWRLAENEREREGEYGRPPTVRFVWGKAWNIPGVVAAVAERLEYFTQSGTPRRSWLRLRMLRTGEMARPEPAKPAALEGTEGWGDWPTPAEGQELQHYDVMGDGEGSAERPDLIAVATGNDAEDWPRILELSGVDDPASMLPGDTIVTYPPKPV